MEPLNSLDVLNLFSFKRRVSANFSSAFFCWWGGTTAFLLPDLFSFKGRATANLFVSVFGVAFVLF